MFLPHPGLHHTFGELKLNQFEDSKDGLVGKAYIVMVYLLLNVLDSLVDDHVYLYIHVFFAGFPLFPLRLCSHRRQTTQREEEDSPSFFIIAFAKGPFLSWHC